MSICFQCEGFHHVDPDGFGDEHGGRKKVSDGDCMFSWLELWPKKCPLCLAHELGIVIFGPNS